MHKVWNSPSTCCQPFTITQNKYNICTFQRQGITHLSHKPILPPYTPLKQYGAWQPYICAPYRWDFKTLHLINETKCTSTAFSHKFLRKCDFSTWAISAQMRYKRNIKCGPMSKKIDPCGFLRSLSISAALSLYSAFLYIAHKGFPCCRYVTYWLTRTWRKFQWSKSQDPFIYNREEIILLSFINIESTYSTAHYNSILLESIL